MQLSQGHLVKFPSSEERRAARDIHLSVYGGTLTREFARVSLFSSEQEQQADSGREESSSRDLRSRFMRNKPARQFDTSD